MLSFPLITCQSDARADHGARWVAFEKDRVTVERVYAGIWMRVSVPFRHFSGVLLSVSRNGMLRLSLIHRDPDLCLLINESDDDRNILAHFSEVARRLSLPRHVEPETGKRICLDLCMGGILCGRMPVVRRRGAVAIKRRPRFLLRRRMGERRLMKPLLR